MNLPFKPRSRAIVLAIFCVVTLLTIPGLTQLSITPDNRVFYGESDSYFNELREFEQLFTSNTRIAFVTSCPQPIEHCADLRDSAQWLATNSYDMPYVIRVDSIATFPTLVSTEDTVSSYSTLEFVCPPNKPCNPSQLHKFEQPLLAGRYIDSSRSTLGTLVSLDLEVGSVDAVSKSYETAQQLLDKHRLLYPNLDIRYIGTVPLMQSFVLATERDLGTVFAVAAIVILVILFLCLQSIKLVGIMLFLGVFSIGITLGIAGWAGLVLNTATSTIPLILFTLITATSMHYFMHLLRSSSDNPSWTPEQAAQAALNTQWKPVTLTTLTTAACMLSLLSVDSPPVADIGLWTSIGICIGTALLLFVLPIVFSATSRPRPSKWQNFLQQRLNLYARLVEQDSVPLKSLVAVLVASSALILSLEVDDDFVRYFGKSNSFRVDTELVAQRLFGPSNVEIQVDSGVDDGVHTPEYLNYIYDLTEFVRSNTAVKNAISYSDVVEEINTHFGSNPSFIGLNAATIAQMFMAYEFSLEIGQSTNDIVDQSNRYSRVSLSLSDISSKEVVALESLIYEWADNRNEEFKVLVTGESIPISHLSSRNIRSMLISISATFLATAVLLAFVFRNFRVGLISLISTIVPVSVGFGLWSIGSDTIGLSTTVIISVCIGVVIDDSIHLIHRHFDAIDELSLGRKQAAAYAIHRVGAALVTTTLVVVCGFMALMLSDFRINSTFAACSSLILVSALIFDLLISPKLLVWATPKNWQ